MAPGLGESELRRQQLTTRWKARSAAAGGAAWSNVCTRRCVASTAATFAVPNSAATLPMTVALYAHFDTSLAKVTV